MDQERPRRAAGSARRRSRSCHADAEPVNTPFALVRLALDRASEYTEGMDFGIVTAKIEKEGLSQVVSA